MRAELIILSKKRTITAIKYTQARKSAKLHNLQYLCRIECKSIKVTTSKIFADLRA